MSKNDVIAILDRADQQAVRIDLATFFGPRAATYLATYDAMRFKESRRRLLTIGWCWPAFLASFVWFLYRKMYIAGALILVIPIVIALVLESSNGFSGLAVVFALYGKSMYVRTGLDRIVKADKLGLAGSDRQEYLTRAGGVSLIAGILAGLLFAGLVALVLMGQVARQHH